MWTIIGDIVTPENILKNAAITIGDQGEIAAISSKYQNPSRSSDIDASGYLVLPGFIDMHVHGGGGADFMQGTKDAVHQAAKTHARFGTTSLLATTLTASREAIDLSLSAISAVMQEGRAQDEAHVLGIHLEGPYVCHARRGAQPEAFVRMPDLEEFQHWISQSRMQSVRLR